MSLKDLHDDAFMVIGAPRTRADNLVAKQGDGDGAGPGTYSSEATKWRAMAQVSRDLIDESVVGYISMWEGEDDTEFEVRRANSIYGFVNFTEDAVNGLVDQVFAKPVQVEDEPEKIAEFLENVTRKKGAPVSASQFFRRMAEAEVGYGGNPLILIDHPPRSVLAEDEAEEADQGLGPHFGMIHPWAIIDAREDEEGNLVHLRYVSNQTESVGDFGSQPVGRIVLLERGEVGGFATRRVFVWDEGKSEYLEDSEQAGQFDPGNVSADIRARFREIPVVGMAEWWSRPKLRNVAMLNILHLRKRTDYDVAEAISSVPMNAFFGFSPEDMASGSWGPYRYIRTDKSPQEAGVQNVSFGFETAQTALKTLESIERYIAVKSKDPQSQRATGEEKATIRLLDEAKKISRLQAWALSWLASYQAATNWAGWWMGIEDAGRLSYLPEVFEALSESPTWSDYADFVQRVLDSPPETWEWQISEAKRFGVIADEKPTDELLAMLTEAAAGGGGE